MIWPLAAQSVVQQVIDFTGSAERLSQPVLVHGFSVGGYLYGETLVKVLENPQSNGQLPDRIIGQIFDSPVDIQGVPFGVSRAVTDNKVLQNIIQSSLELYLKVSENYTTKYYLKSSAAFHKNEMKVPSLLLYSERDPIGEAGQIELVMNKWKNNGTVVHSRKWEDSHHVSHYHQHPVEYIASLNQFLASIGLVDKDEHAAYAMRAAIRNS